MKLLHPDKHALSSSEVQQETASRSTQITHGYQILKNDYQRALHLLELNGHGLEEEDGMSISGDIVGMDVLMLVMEVRELVDNEEDVKELEGMMKDNDERVEDTTRMLEEAFERDDMGEAKRLVATLQYWNRIHDTILEKL
jgi:molecular chaperone HscB